jgi:hypothetical protein
MQQPTGVDSMGMAGFVCMFLCIAASVCLAIFVWGTIFKKAGYSFWMALLMLIPIVNLIRILVFAFSEWPIHKELSMFRTRYGQATSGFPVMQPGQMPPPQFPR